MDQVSALTFPVPIVGKGGSANALLLGPGGRVQLSDGTVFSNPSAAACHVEGGKGLSGWRYWMVAGQQPLKSIEELRRRHPDVFSHTMLPRAEGKVLHLDQMSQGDSDSGDDPRNFYKDHAACIRLWADMLEQAGAKASAPVRLVHPDTPGLPAATFTLERVNGTVNLLLCSLRLLSRRQDRGWFRATVQDGDEARLIVVASEGPDVCLHALTLSTEQVQTICRTFNASVLSKVGVAGRMRLNPPQASVSARLLSEPPTALVRACIRFAANHCNANFVFGGGYIRLTVDYGRAVLE
tara:strand:+ start:5180 stop:6067 length:888 start_codon:yes stop_codon:yes gene_type:complete